ncbi:hypothetical protein LWI28_005711 [Acer negundo]|uniref:Aminotransferase-like plant mobile domain-containing protein n=1 Tax=Acer negundo TaxID=4023 RepID=A0AAD5J488_ACENE|nr:hypothetical protein LWI28_005711 [Acer negundo]
MVDARDTTKGLSMSSQRHSDAGNGQLGDGSVVEREELMVSASGDGEPTVRSAHFLEPTVTSNDGQKNTDLVLGLAEKWCSDTKSFIFSWGEATITLEDLMIHGYSVLGSPVFIASGTEELKKRGEIEPSKTRTHQNLN